MQKESLSMRDKELPFIQNMFDKIAPKYDLLNRLLSLRQDVAWRRQLVLALCPQENDLILDVACGTGDVALTICQTKDPHIKVIGVDFAPQMLINAKKKIDAVNKSKEISLMAADALLLPFKKSVFDAATIAFGIRNIVDKDMVLKSFYNSIKKGGRLLVLELGTPSKGFLRWMYLRYFRKILPIIGAIFSKDKGAYRYLPDSVLKFPSEREFAGMMSSAGFHDVKWKSLTFGIATLFIGRKP
jgi:demethylmenaquinone methyltransferase/2-methoxy-6-polyprenyl-1,4-benzoquinol methylase